MKHDEHDANPESIRRALQPDFPRWRQAFDAYRRNKPIGNRPGVLLVNLSATTGILHCKACKRKTEIPSGVRVVECCAWCGSWETVWISEPAYERVRVMGCRGGYGDPYTGRDFCLDLERWCECITKALFRCADGYQILEMMGLYDMGKDRIAKALTNLGHPISPRSIVRIRSAWQICWETGCEKPEGVQALNRNEAQGQPIDKSEFAPHITP